MRLSTIAAGFAAAFAIGSAFGASAQTPGVIFHDVSIQVALDCQNYAASPFNGCGGGTTTPSTLNITVSGFSAQVDLVVNSSPSSSQTFSFDIPNYTEPTGYLTTMMSQTQAAPRSDWSPYFEIAGNGMVNGTATNANWDYVTYPYVTFWSAIDGGGITIANCPGEGECQNGVPAADILIDTYAVPLNTSFSVTPEPESWALMLLGVGLAGTALRRRAARAV